MKFSIGNTHRKLQCGHSFGLYKKLTSNQNASVTKNMIYWYKNIKKKTTKTMYMPGGATVPRNSKFKNRMALSSDLCATLYI